jgi:hypothetical protein
VVSAPPSSTARSDFLLIGGAAKCGSSRPVSMIFGANGGAGAKALLEASNGDARGRRFLLGGIVMVLSVLPHHQHGGKPLIRLAGLDSGGNTMLSPPWRRCLGCWWSPRRGMMESKLVAALSEGFQGAMYAIRGAS